MTPRAPAARRLAGAGWLLLLGALCPAWAADLPGIGARDPRVPVDIRQSPWAAVARLQIPGIDRCTAFLVAPTTAVTAAHCLWGARPRRFMPPESVHVLTGYAFGAYARHGTALSYRVAAGYDPMQPYRTLGADVAVLTLAAPLVARDMALSLAPDGLKSGTALMLGGFSQDRGEILLADPACRAIAEVTDAAGALVLRHDCTATHGSSGAPLLVRTPRGWLVAGVQVAARVGETGGEAVPAAVARALMQ